MVFMKEGWLQGIVNNPSETYFHIFPRDTLEGKDVHAALAAQFGAGVYRAFNHGTRIVVMKNRLRGS